MRFTVSESPDWLRSKLVAASRSETEPLEFQDTLLANVMAQLMIAEELRQIREMLSGLIGSADEIGKIKVEIHKEVKR